MRIVILIFTLLFSFPAAAVWAQGPEVQWEIALGDTMASDFGRGAFQTADGGYIVGGNSNAWAGGFYDNVMFKLNSDGDTLWSASAGGNDSQENSSCFRLMPDGSYMFSGYTNQDPPGGYAYLFNANPDGSYNWTGLYGSESIPETGTCMAAAGDTAYVLMTGCWYSPEYGYDMRMYYLGMTGWESWTQPYRSVVADGANCINALTTGDYIVTGYTQDPEYYDYELLMLRLGSLGGIQAWNPIGGTNDDAGNWVIETADGGFLATGYTKEIDGVGKDVFVVKTDSNCVPEWQQIYGFSYHDEGRYCAQTADGGYVIGATCAAYATFDFWVLRLNADGDTLWTKIIERGGSQSFYSLDITDDGGYLLCGNTQTPRGDYDMYVVKLGPDPVGIDDNDNRLPKNNSLIQNYPNPFNAATTIKFTLDRSQYVSLEIYDILGRRIEILVNGRLDAGRHSCRYDASTLAGGVYFYKLTAGDFSEYRKMLLLK